MDNTKDIYLILAMLGTLATIATVGIMAMDMYAPMDDSPWVYGENETKIF